MNKIVAYRKLLNVTKDATLKELKTIYRNSMKDFHPDKFTDATEKAEAEETSTAIIEAYHFLVSIAPETISENLENYTKTINEARILDFKHKGLLLEISLNIQPLAKMVEFIPTIPVARLLKLFALGAVGLG
jgi:hypothetical protein